MGILPQILLSDPSASRARQCRPWIERLIREQLDDGNWNLFVIAAENKDKNGSDLVQITHGAPGVVVALLAMRPIYAEASDDTMVASIDRAINKAQDVIWEQGLLRKESCLLHGASGNSLALLDRERQATFLAKSTNTVTEAGLADGTLEASSSPYGLHRGLMGTIFAMCEYRIGRSGIMPSFNDA